MVVAGQGPCAPGDEPQRSTFFCGTEVLWAFAGSRLALQALLNARSCARKVVLACRGLASAQEAFSGSNSAPPKTATARHAPASSCQPPKRLARRKARRPAC